MAARKESATETTNPNPINRIAEFVVLPPMRGLPRGSVLIATYEGEELRGKAMLGVQSSKELNSLLANKMAGAGLAGFTVRLAIACQVNYKTTLSMWQQKPHETFAFVQSHVPQWMEQKEGEEVPF